MKSSITSVSWKLPSNTHWFVSAIKWFYSLLVITKNYKMLQHNQ